MIISQVITNGESLSETNQSTHYTTWFTKHSFWDRLKSEFSVYYSENGSDSINFSDSVKNRLKVLEIKHSNFLIIGSWLFFFIFSFQITEEWFFQWRKRRFLWNRRKFQLIEV